MPPWPAVGASSCRHRNRHSLSVLDSSYANDGFRRGQVCHVASHPRCFRTTSSLASSSRPRDQHRGYRSCLLTFMDRRRWDATTSPKIPNEYQPLRTESTCSTPTVFDQAESISTPSSIARVRKPPNCLTLPSQRNHRCWFRCRPGSYDPHYRGVISAKTPLDGYRLQRLRRLGHRRSAATCLGTWLATGPRCEIHRHHGHGQF